MNPLPNPFIEAEGRSANALRVLVLGATGTIGRATALALLRRGHEVVCFVRDPAANKRRAVLVDPVRVLPGATLRFGEVSDLQSLTNDGFCGERFDAVVSCLASRTGVPADAWAIDYQAHLHALECAKRAGVTQMVLLSAICVQKPILAFQKAKLAFEAELIGSGLRYSIVRPTAFFKSLSGQIERVKSGKPFLVFGDGTLTACKPISDADLGDYIADCLVDQSRWNRVLPIGGPGKAMTPREQAEELFHQMDRPTKLRHVPVAMLDVIIAVLTAASKLLPALAVKAELARIGRYYATESMLVWNPRTNQYSADETPSTGTETLASHYAALLSGSVSVDRGDHAVF
jgi:divinyl chlorophyllide a 8-vinyl-reductase